MGCDVTFQSDGGMTRDRPTGAQRLGDEMLPIFTLFDIQRRLLSARTDWIHLYFLFG